MAKIKRIRLEIFRCLFCAGLVVACARLFFPLQAVYSTGVLRPWFLELNLDPTWYLVAVYLVLIPALILCALGVALRVLLLVALIAFSMVAAPAFTTGLYPMSDVCFYVLLSLWLSALFYVPERISFPLSKSGRDRMVPEIALSSVYWILAAIYFNAFLNKFALSGGDWLDGSTLQTFVLVRALALDKAWLAEVARSEFSMTFFSWGALVIEGGFILGLLFRRLRPVFISLGLGFHLVTLVALEANFMWFYLPAYLAFFDWTLERSNT